MSRLIDQAVCSRGFFAYTVLCMVVVVADPYFTTSLAIYDLFLVLIVIFVH